MSRIVSIAAVLVIVAATILYSLFAHRLTASDDRSELAYAFALASLFLVAVCLVISHRRRWLFIGMALAAGLVAWSLRHRLVWDPRWIYLLQHVGANVGLALLFGLSLRSARGSLVTRMAVAIQGELPDEVARYTRQVTWAWTVFFVLMAVVSIGLFWLADMSTWSVFINFLTLPLVALMFVVEYSVRRVVLPNMEHKGILAGVRAYAQLGRRNSPPDESLPAGSEKTIGR